MIVCPRCGTQAPDGTPACPRCGLGPTGPVAPPPRRTRRRGLLVAVLGLVLVLVVGAVVAGVVLLRGGGDRGGLLVNGLEQSLPSPPDEEPEEAWTWSYDGVLTAGFAVDGGAMVSSSEDPEGPARVTGLDADGEEQWVVDFESSRSGTPAADGYVAGVGGDTDGAPSVELAATDDGEVRWTEQGNLLGRTDDGLVLADGERVFLAEYDDGAERWGRDVGLATTERDGVLVAQGSEVALLDAGDGEGEWTAEVDGDVTSVTLSSDLAVVTTDDRVVAYDRDGGDELWSLDQAGARPYPTSSGDVLVVAEGQARLHDADGPSSEPFGTDLDESTQVVSWAADGGDLHLLDGETYDEDGSPVDVDCEVGAVPVAQGVLCLDEGSVGLVEDPAGDAEEAWELDLDADFGFALDGGLVLAREGELVGYR